MIKEGKWISWIYIINYNSPANIWSAYTSPPSITKTYITINNICPTSYVNDDSKQYRRSQPKSIFAHPPHLLKHPRVIHTFATKEEKRALEQVARNKFRFLPSTKLATVFIKLQPVFFFIPLFNQSTIIELFFLNVV